MVSSPYKALIFDVDGTLVNSVPMITAGLGDTFEQLTGVRPSEEELHELIGTPLTSQMNFFGLGSCSETTLEQRIALTIENYKQNSHLCSLFPEAVESFNIAIACAIPVALVTSRNADEVAWLLEMFPQFSQANVIVSASDVDHPKPAPDPAILAATKLGVEPEECLFIGDSLHDFHCANACAMPSLSVTYGACSIEELLAAGSTHLVDHPEDLLRTLKQTVFEPLCARAN